MKEPIDYDGTRPVFYRSDSPRETHEAIPLSRDELEEFDQRYHMSEHGHRCCCDPDEDMARLFATAAIVFQKKESNGA